MMILPAPLNIPVKKKAYNAWNKGDFYSENTILAELCDPDGYEILDMSPM